MSNQVVADALRALENRHGQLSPELVVEAAADPESPLHDHFEWDDEVAGHAYRLDQARALIVSVKYEVVTETFKGPVVSYVHDVRAGTGSGYVNTTRLTKGELVESTLAEEVKRVLALYRRGLGVAAKLGRDAEYKANVLAEIG